MLGVMAALAMAGVPQDTARCAQVWTVNAVAVRPGMWDHARRYYETGWLPARREALKRGQIADFRLLVTRARRDEAPQIQLVTVYLDKAQFDAREANFQAIFRDHPAPRPITIDGKTREQIFASTAGLDDYGEGFGGCS